MAAYATLVSLMHTIEQIEHHPRPPISLDETQVQSLTEKITFLQEFLEGYSYNGYSNEADKLEMRIADAAYAAEDVIDSHIVDQIHAGSAMHIADAAYLTEDVIKSHTVDQIHVGSTSQDKAISSNDFYEGLEKTIQDLDLIMKEATEIKEKIGEQDPILRKSTPASAVRSSSTGQNMMVGFDDLLNEVMDKLTDGQSSRQIIPIVGMGGSGKTTLAKNVYENQVVVQRFDILVWVTISQECSVRDVLLQLLAQEGGERKSDESDLGDNLHKRLSGRRYLIVMDDIWDIEVWDQIRIFFPNNNNGSRIMLTTRLSNLASEVADSNFIKISLLDEDNSWALFCKKVFGEERCPFYGLQSIGKKIVNKCKGLPLSIAVVGGLLAKTEHKYWGRIGENISSIVNSEDDESCLRILHMSYSQLPVYLKPCFLYMGVFQEDNDIPTSTLVKLWVGEGFVKPIRGKSLEEVAGEYLKDLAARNLIVGNHLGSIGRIKSCRIHDLLRDLCLREAKKERFYNLIGQHSLAECLIGERRIVVLDRKSKGEVDGLESRSLARSLIWDIADELPSIDVRLLKVLKSKYSYRQVQEDMFKFVNSRHIAFGCDLDSKLASSVYLLWNLQTLVVDCKRGFHIPEFEIWKMPQLRHVEFAGGLRLPEPPTNSVGIVLQNLQKLTTVINFKCGDDVVERIPNIRSLKLCYEDSNVRPSYFRLNKLERLHKLESFGISILSRAENDFLPNLTFPHSLKKLVLNTNLYSYWNDIIGKIGSLPCLEKLRLADGSFRGCKWETVEGQFRRLKFLEIEGSDLRYWTTENTHFPCLERLVLRQLWSLAVIPSDIGEIPTLLSIEVIWCSESAAISAKEIVVEQEELGNDGLQVKVTLHLDNEVVECLRCPSFQVSIHPLGSFFREPVSPKE